METANFVLRTWDILPNNSIANQTDNNIGSIYGNGCVLTWKNINLQQVIGDSLWNKYERFNLVLRCYGYKPSSPVGGTTDPNPHRNPSIWISGLSFSNSKIQNCIGVEQFPTQTSDGFIALRTKNPVSFNKLRQIVDITIEMKTSHTNTVDGFSEKPAYLIGHHTFIFSIIPDTKSLILNH